ncbi:hypothetical protein ACIGW4_11905 [Streptomyces sp. NPDC053513]|uniref:Uncharacterized protein n=1 Tax=Streptomyces litmocidini TaxID=67318 RepID=A0ABW7U7N1_9ACTN
MSDAVTREELKKQLDEFHESLIKGSEPVKATYPKDPKDQGDDVKDPKKKEKEETFQVSKLKQALIDAQPRIVTDAMLPFAFVSRFAEMYEELHKELSSELLESWGLDTLGGAVEKFHENHEAKWAYFWTAIGGLLVPLLAASLVIVLRKAILDGFRKLQALVFSGQAYALNEDQTRIQRQPLQNIRDREAQGAAVVLTDPPDPARLNDLKQALGQINRRIINFNKAVGKMKSAAALKRLAGGVEAVTKATDAANPTEIEKLADAIGKIGDAQDKFNPRDLPKPRTLQATADAAKDLATATGTLRTKLNEFAASVRTLDDVIGTATG